MSEAIVGGFGIRTMRIAIAAATVLAAVAGFTSAPHADGPRSVAPLAKRLSGAVVNISTSQRIKGPSGVPLPRVPDGSPFEDLFKDFFNKKG